MLLILFTIRDNACFCFFSNLKCKCFEVFGVFDLYEFDFRRNAKAMTFQKFEILSESEIFGERKRERGESESDKESFQSYQNPLV